MRYSIIPLVEGEDTPDYPGTTWVGDGWELQAPGCARMRSVRTVVVPVEDAADLTVLWIPSPGRETPKVSRVGEGPAPVWSYGDHHGGGALVVLVRGHEYDAWVPGHHDHGPGTTWRFSISPSGEVRGLRRHGSAAKRITVRREGGSAE